jgi:hypothetical protein
MPPNLTWPLVSYHAGLGASRAVVQIKITRRDNTAASSEYGSEALS